MKLLLLCPQWGSEHDSLELFVARVKAAQYDGIDTWVPQQATDRQRLRYLLEQHDLVMVSHQHQARGHSIKDFCASYEYFLNCSLETEPLFINSHSGRDYFSLDDQLRVLDTAATFVQRHGIRVVHETHRGRIGYSPASAQILFDLRPDYALTADLSHWVCVTESYLEGYPEQVREAIRRATHLHARVGFPQGPQVPDPFAPEWAEALRHFLIWWDAAVDQHQRAGADYFTITPEAGPPPYMWTLDGRPLAHSWDVNLAMQQFLRRRYTPSPTPKTA